MFTIPEGNTVYRKTTSLPNGKKAHRNYIADPNDKKTNLLDHHIKYLPYDTKSVGPRSYYSESVFLTKWINKRDVIVFRLSNNIIQFYFNSDKTTIIISERGEIITYIDANNRIYSYWTGQTPTSLRDKITKIQNQLRSVIN